MKIRIVLLILASFGAVLLSLTPNRVYASDISYAVEQDARKYANENNTWAISEHQGIRNSPFYKLDTDGEYLFFSYSNENCVDAYDNQGTFAYCIVLPDRQNGAVAVRCNNEQVYISAKDDTVYVLQGKTEVDRLSSVEAAEKGFDFYWFYEDTPYIKVDSNQITVFDHDNKMIRQIQTPSVVAQSIPKSRDMHLLLMLAGTLILLATAFYVYLSKNRVGKT